MKTKPKDRERAELKSKHKLWNKRIQRKQRWLWSWGGNAACKMHRIGTRGINRGDHYHQMIKEIKWANISGDVWLTALYTFLQEVWETDVTFSCTDKTILDAIIN